jgi:putative transposase
MRQFGNGKQLLQLIPQKNFRVLCQKWSIDHRLRSFSAWDQVCTFIMAYMLRLESLREIETVLSVPRSTFSDANTRRCSGFFQELCELVLEELERVGGRKKASRCARKLFALDSTECDVHGSVGTKYPNWRKKPSDKKDAAAKLHTIWNVSGEAIEDYRITTARTNDSPVAEQFEILPGATYVFDRGYTGLAFWWKIIDSGAHFVSRLKVYKNYRRDMKKLRTFPESQIGVLWDGDWRPCKQVIRARGKEREIPVFRRILYRDPESKKAFEFITSNRRYSAQTIADIYKKRWSVELLFRWLKGHLGIRRLKMKSVNSIKIQLAMAVLMQLLVQLYRLKNKLNATLWECLRTLRAALAMHGLGNQAFATTRSRKGPASAHKKRIVSML